MLVATYMVGTCAPQTTDKPTESKKSTSSNEDTTYRDLDAHEVLLICNLIEIVLSMCAFVRQLELHLAAGKCVQIIRIAVW